MSLKLKLISILALFTLMLGVLIMGVFAVTQNIGLKGSISFNVPDKSLFVKDIRVQTEVTGKAETIDNFMPGYLNENFVLDLGTVESESGTIGLYFDIVNTTDLRYEITNISLPETLTSQGIIASDSGIIEVNNLTDTDGDNYKEITDVATAPYDTLTLLITTSNASANLSIALDGTVITIDEYLVEYTDFAFARTSDSTGAITAYTGSATEVEIPATFSVKTEQLSTSGYTVKLGNIDDFSNYIMSGGGYNQVVLMAGFYWVTSDGMERTYIEDGNAFLTEAMGGQIQFPITIEFTDYEVTYQDFTSLEYAEYAITRPIYEVMAGNIESVTMEFGTQAKYEFNVANVEDVFNGEIIINPEDESFFPVKVSYPSEKTTYVEGEDYQVTNIGSMAFYGSNITKITIPEGVTSIGSSAFENCSGLTSVSLPSTLTSIDEYAFRYCSSLTGNLVIPEGVTSIEEYTFYGCTNLTSITIPERVTSIEEYTFYGCTNLTSITIPEGVTSIGAYAFTNCNGLTNITIPSSVTSIGSWAFENCSGLTYMNYLGTLAKWCAIDFGSVYSNPTVYTGALYIQGEELTTLNIPEGVTSIGAYAFYNCNGLTDVSMPSTLTSIGSYAFDGCTSLTSVIVPEGVTSIGNYAFSGCSKLASITLPSTLTSIGSWAFNLCSSLTKMDYLGALADWCEIEFGFYSSNPTYYTGALYIQGQELTTLNIPEGVTSIGAYAFYNCSGLTSVSLPNTLTSIGPDVFSGCNSLIYYEENGASYLGNESNPYMYLADVSTTATEYTINSRTKFIGSRVFSDNSTLTSITIPEGVTSIGNYAFYNCSGLTSVTLPSTLTSIGENAFAYCDGLTNITLPSSLTSIDDYAFAYCDGFTSITIPEGVTSIGPHAFYSCDGLTSITLPSTLTSIGGNAFFWCDNLTTVTINEYIYTNAWSYSSCGYILENAQTVYVPEELVNNSALTMGDYLQNNFTQGELANGLYTYTKNQ